MTNVPRAARPLLVIATALRLLLFPLTLPLLDLGGSEFFDFRSIVFPSDVLGLVALVALPFAIPVRPRPGPGAILLAVLTASLAFAFAFHPSLQGVLVVLRFAMAAALAYALFAFTREERTLAVGALAAGALLQVIVAVGQEVARVPLGIPGEIADPFLVYGGHIGPRGTMTGQPTLAGYAAVVALLVIHEAFDRRRAIAWFLIAGIASVPVGLGFSRAAALAIALACAALALAWRTSARRAAAAILVLVIGVGSAALVTWDGWFEKVSNAGVIGPDGRDIILEHSFALIERQPLVGVGPGNTAAALKALTPVPHTPFDYLPPHSFVLDALVEGGISAGLAAVSLLVVLALRSLRSPLRLAVCVAFLPMLVLDQWGYVQVQGIVLLGAWVGTLDVSHPTGGERAGERAP